MKYLLLLFQLVWFYVPFVYWIVNGVYCTPVCCTRFFVSSRTQRINLFTMRNMKLPFQAHLDAQMEISQSVRGSRALDTRLFKTMMYPILSKLDVLSRI